MKNKKEIVKEIVKIVRSIEGFENCGYYNDKRSDNGFRLKFVLSWLGWRGMEYELMMKKKIEVFELVRKYMENNMLCGWVGMENNNYYLKVYLKV